MKRSAVNQAIAWAKDYLQKNNIHLPEYAYWPLETWKANVDKLDTVRKVMLGWDITDYGLDDFEHIGAVLYTVRNGSINDKSVGVPFAEKYIILRSGQRLTNHYHVAKTEDIINRGGGNVLIRVYNSLPNEEIDYESDVTVHTDGRSYTVPAGSQIRLTPGESIHVQQYLYHDFTVEPGTGPVLLGEVSQCNDDSNDNRFNPPMGRFPAIEEDEAPYRLLCTEYPEAKD